VIVSHDLAALLNMCTRGIWMHEGQVEADGTIAEAITAYLTFTQSIDAKAAAAAQLPELAESA
jgi:ABC-type polysaccharide/polyol phosphate transport system ATPase subunit